MRRRLGRIACAALLAGGAATGASAQGGWTIGRPEPLPEFDSPLPKPRPKPAPAAKPAAVPAPARPAPVVTPPALSFANPGESAALNEVVVIGRPPGPALWRVRKGAGEVVILGGLSPLPHLQTWNPVRVAAALQGARQLLLPRTELGAFQGALLMVRAGAIRLPGTTPLDARLPAALRAKFDAAATLARQTPTRYAKWKPVAAAAYLVSDFRRAAGFSTAKPGSAVEHMAKAAGVPVRTLAQLGLSPLYGELVGLPEAKQLACLDAAVDEVNQEALGARLAAQAWADGRLDQVQAHWATALLDRCVLPNARAQAVIEKGTVDATRALNQALDQPGRTVALVDLHFLLRSNGILDRLKAGGAQITVPQ